MTVHRADLGGVMLMFHVFSVVQNGIRCVFGVSQQVAQTENALSMPSRVSDSAFYFL